MGAITEIFRTFGPEYLARYPDAPLQHKKTIEAIINCRSGSYGVADARRPAHKGEGSSAPKKQYLP